MMLSLFRNKSFVLPSLILHIILLLTAVTHALPRPQLPHEARNLATLRSIYNLTIWPNQLPIFAGGAAGVPQGLFNANASGRVDPVGNFTGFEDSIEYFFALAPTPDSGVRSVITKAEIVEFSSSCPEVAASVVYLETGKMDPANPGKMEKLATLKQVAFWRFDDCGAVLKYDAWIPNLNAWIENVLGTPISNPFLQAVTIQDICSSTQLLCTDGNKQWNDVNECVTALSAKPYGTYDEAWGDNIVCRTIHLVLAGVRPVAHCPHVGPTGGGKCVNYNYELSYFNDQALFGDPRGETFQCPRPKSKYPKYPYPR
ncbi:MAG: hypothetical protein M1839_006940 [Geoglossum umbratile]|nr:MAG: hypothetical protein M1839_006940 [Geoglossum umbratile]